MGTDEKQSILLSEGDIKKIVSYLKSIDGVNIIPCDEPLKGIKGIYAFHVLDKNIPNDSPMYEERELLLGYRFAKPVEPEDEVRLEVDYVGQKDSGMADKEYLASQIVPIIKIIEKCLTEDGDWVKYDNPKKLRIGFIKYADTYSTYHEKSQYISMGLSVYKLLPQELQDRIEKFRKKDLSLKEQEFIEQTEDGLR